MYRVRPRISEHAALHSGGCCCERKNERRFQMTSRNWWSLVIRGLLAIAVGVVAIGWPGITLAALVMLFGAYALLDGVVSIIAAWRAARAHDRWAGLAVEGIAGVAAAATTVLC